jgi:hypothetical protein
VLPPPPANTIHGIVVTDAVQTAASSYQDDQGPEAGAVGPAAIPRPNQTSRRHPTVDSIIARLLRRKQPPQHNLNKSLMEQTFPKEKSLDELQSFIRQQEAWISISSIRRQAGARP